MKHVTKQFSWQGKNEQNTLISGEISAASLLEAKIILRNKNILILKIKQKNSNLFAFRNKITSTDITIFTRQLAIMTATGIQMFPSLELIANGCSNTEMQQLINHIKLTIAAGQELSNVLSNYPEHFNGFYCSLIRVGEKVGALATILDQLASYREKTDILLAKLKKALIYPLTIIVVTVLITLITLIFVIPQFQSLFNNFGAELPLVTRIIIKVSKFFAAYWQLLLSALVGLAMTLRYLYKKNIAMQHALQSLSLKLPIIGALIIKSATARFARTLATTSKAGIPLIDSLTTVMAATGNIRFEIALQHIREAISQGMPLHQAMLDSGIFPAMVPHMVCIGEETGKLDYMLIKIADYYETEVDIALDSINTLLEPVIMIVLGVIIGGLVIAMYLPIFQMGLII